MQCKSHGLSESYIIIRTTDNLCTGDCQCYRICVILDIYRTRDPHVELTVTHAQMWNKIMSAQERKVVTTSKLVEVGLAIAHNTFNMWCSFDAERSKVNGQGHNIDIQLYTSPEFIGRVPDERTWLST